MIALDVGARSARAVWVSLHGDRPKVTRAETFALPMDEENTHKLIAAWIDSLGIAKHFCAVALPGAQAVFQSGRIMHNDPRTPEQVAAMDIAQFSEMAGDAMSYDVAAFETPFEVGVRRYIMSMARPASVNEAIQGTRQNHLRPADLIASPVALYNAMEALAGPHEDSLCYVSIGHTQTDVAVGTDRGLLFARSIAAGGKLFTDAVAQSAGLPAVQAEVRKHVDCGLRENDACSESLRAAADRWVSQFNACLGVYRSSLNDRRFNIAKIVLTGGGAQLKGLKEYLAAKLALPVITSAELPAVPADYRPHAGAYDLAFGIALSAMGCGATTLSLLPGDLKDEVVFREKKPWWIAAAVFLLLAMALYSVTGFFLLKYNGGLLDKEREKLASREKTDKRIQELRQLQAQLLTNSVPLSALLVNGPLSREVLTLVTQNVDPEDWLTLFCDEKIYNPDEQKTEAKANSPQDAARNPFSLFRTLRPAAAPAPAPAGTAAAAGKEAADRKELVDPLTSVFIVEGYTANPSLKSVREMIGRLKTSPEILRADLRKDDQVLAPVGIPASEQDLVSKFRRFVIEIEVKRP
ncbi:MAG: pilus assembly protein PilM [Verrucomicrobiota bacterium]|jgi:Tfp pilus assembly PilM family ATPase|nr:pilus assembly protein PilM [Verrucomicrobiota bacterium]